MTVGSDRRVQIPECVCVCVLMSGFSPLLVSLMSFHHSNLSHLLVDSPVLSFFLKVSLAGPLYRRESECVCVSVGVQVMSFLTAVERRCYCSAPLMKASPLLVNTHSSLPPSFHPAYKQFLSQLQVGYIVSACASYTIGT